MVLGGEKTSKLPHRRIDYLMSLTAWEGGRRGNKGRQTRDQKQNWEASKASNGPGKKRGGRHHLAQDPQVFAYPKNIPRTRAILLT